MMGHQDQGSVPPFFHQFQPFFQYFNDTSYTVSGLNYMKPEIISAAISYTSNVDQLMSINFEVNQVSYKGHLNLKDYYQYKF